MAGYILEAIDKLTAQQRELQVEWKVPAIVEVCFAYFTYKMQIHLWARPMLSVWLELSSFQDTLPRTAATSSMLLMYVFLYIHDIALT